jgi:hypothetical protein
MKGYTININDIFFGSEQSKYAGAALFMTIGILCLSILFSSSKIPFGERFMFVLFILLITVPSILMSLFELTCITTGGNYNYRWWCWLLAWVLSAIIILYCVLIIISMFISMSSYDMANHRLDVKNEEDKIDSVDANNYAKKIMIDQKIKENMSQSYNQMPLQVQQPPLQVQQPPQQVQQPPQQVQQRMNTNTPAFSQPVPNMNVQQRPMSTDLTGFDTGDNLAPISSMSPMSSSSMPTNTYKAPTYSANAPQANNFNIGGFDNTEAQYQSF